MGEINDWDAGEKMFWANRRGVLDLSAIRVEACEILLGWESDMKPTETDLKSTPKATRDRPLTDFDMTGPNRCRRCLREGRRKVQERARPAVPCGLLLAP